MFYESFLHNITFKLPVVLLHSVDTFFTNDTEEDIKSNYIHIHAAKLFKLYCMSKIFSVSYDTIVFSNTYLN